MFTDIAQQVLNQWNAEDLQPNDVLSAEDIAIQFQNIGINANTELLEGFSPL